MEGRIERRKIDNLSQVMEDVNIVVNCTGINARDLVQDKSVVASRGHNVLVKAPHIRKTIAVVSKCLKNRKLIRIKVS